MIQYAGSMSSLITWTLLFTSLLPETAAYAVKRPQQTRNNRISSKHLKFSEPLPVLRPRKDGDPADYSWVKNLAAIGDSFTAGIGAGNSLGSGYYDKDINKGGDNVKCSRYDLSYPILVNNIIGPSVKDFQFPACSGDRSVQIFDQVSNLKKDIDMVIMTAGGNDLCLVCTLPARFRISSRHETDDSCSLE
jgi:hypothetical protein